MSDGAGDTAGGGSSGGGAGAGSGSGSGAELSKLGRAAVSYAKLGWPVFPVEPHGKKPIGIDRPDGPKGPMPADASILTATVEAWWRQWPSANIGLATGPSQGARAGLWVLDLNTRMVDGVAAFKALKAGRDWPQGPFQTTSEGKFGKARQFVFMWPQAPDTPLNVTTSVNKLGSGITVRGAGGYVILPPSTHSSGAQYEWDAERRPSKMLPPKTPDWLLGLIVGPAQTAVEHAAPAPVELQEVERPKREAPRPTRGTPKLAVVGGSAAAAQKPEPETKPVQWSHDPDVMKHCELDKHGSLKPKSTKNAVALLRHHKDMTGMFQFDEFRRKLLINRSPDGRPTNRRYPRLVEDTDITIIQCWLEGCGITVQARTAAQAIELVASENGFHPVRAWMKSLVWDGTERIDHWLTDFCGAEPSPFVCAAGAKWLISGAARIMKPGAKADSILILEGPQGLKKSTAFEIMATIKDEVYFTDGISSIGSKDAAQEISGVMIVELAELNAILKSTTENTNAWLTRRQDRYRPPYGRNVIEVPRENIFGATFNPNGAGYWQDPTGGRRIWPVEVSRIDIDALKGAREQLWAEAVHRYLAGEAWWFEDKEILKEAQEAAADRHDDDLWSETIGGYCARHDKVTMDMVLEHMNMAMRDRNRTVQIRLAQTLRQLGYTKKKGHKHPETPGRTANVWLREGAMGAREDLFEPAEGEEYADHN